MDNTFVPPEIRKGPNVGDANRLAVLEAVLNAGGVSKETLQRHRLWKPGTVRTALEELCGRNGSPLIRVDSGREILRYTLNEDSPEVRKIRGGHASRTGARPAEETGAERAVGCVNGSAHGVPSSATPSSIASATASASERVSIPPPSLPALRRLDTLEGAVESIRTDVAHMGEKLARVLEHLESQVEPEVEVPPVAVKRKRLPAATLDAVPSPASQEGLDKGEETFVIVDGGNFENSRKFIDIENGDVFRNGTIGSTKTLFRCGGASEQSSVPLTILSADSKSRRGHTIFRVRTPKNEEKDITCKRESPCAFHRINWVNFKRALATLGGTRHNVLRTIYFTVFHPDFARECEAAKKVAIAHGITVRNGIHATDGKRDSEDFPVGAAVVGEILLDTVLRRSRGETLPDRMTLILLSGDGGAGYGIANIKTLMKLYHGIELTVKIVSWKNGMSKASRFGYKLDELADEVHFVEDLGLI